MSELSDEAGEKAVDRVASVHVEERQVGDGCGRLGVRGGHPFHKVFDACQSVLVGLPRRRQRAGHDLTGVAVALEDQVPLIVHVVVQGRSRHTETHRDVGKRCEARASCIELLGGDGEQRVAARSAEPV